MYKDIVLAGERLHCWNVSPAEARATQNKLSGPVRQETETDEIRLVAGTDVHPLRSRAASGDEMVGVASILTSPKLKLVETAYAILPVGLPYIPSLLSYREAPALLAAMLKLTNLPQLILVDGQGLAHPLRFGLACHLGVLLALPAIGCAKSILIGKHRPLGLDQRARADLINQGEVVGAAVRTRAGVQSVYVSVGHRVDLEVAIKWVLGCTSRCRIPEPLRHAHLAARRVQTQH